MTQVEQEHTDDTTSSVLSRLPVPVPVAVGLVAFVASLLIRLVAHMVWPAIGGFDVVALALAAIAGVVGWWLASTRRPTAMVVVVVLVAVGALREQWLLVATPVLLACVILAVVIARR